MDSVSELRRIGDRRLAPREERSENIVPESLSSPSKDHCMARRFRAEMADLSWRLAGSEERSWRPGGRRQLRGRELRH